MVEVKNLTKFYGSIKAVDDISFTVETGEVLGFLGPNGAGKSTTMNMITGFIEQTEGEIIIDGYDMLKKPKKAKKEIEKLTTMNVVDITIVAKGIYMPEEKKDI